MAVLQMLLVMLALVASWAALGLMLSGLGLLVGRLTHLRRLSADVLLLSFWLGYALCLGLLQLWNLFWPVGAAALAAVGAAGLAGLLLWRAELWTWLRAAAPRRLPVVVICVLLVLWVANQAAGPCNTRQSGAYQLSGVRWAAAYPLPPGLGLLNAQLSYNNANFLFSALLEIGPATERSHHLHNGLLVAVLLCQCVLSAFGFYTSRHELRSRALFGLVMLAPAVVLAVSAELPTHSPEIPAAVLVFAAAGILVAYLIEPLPEAGQQAFGLICATAMLSCAVCVDSDFAVPAGSMWLLAVGAGIWRGLGRRQPVAATTAWCLVLSAAIVLPWLARNVVISGYAVYPVVATAVPVEWRVSPEQAAAHMKKALVAKRSPKGTKLRWMGPFAALLDGSVLLPVALTAAAGAVFLRQRLLRRTRLPSSGWVMALPLLLAVGVWLLTVPDPSFGLYLFWPLSAVAATATFLAVGRKTRRIALGLILTAAVLVAACQVKRLFRRPGPDFGLHATPSGNITSFTTNSGLVLNVPARGPNCWNAPPPCATGAKPNLRLRRDGDIRRGFVLERPASEPADEGDGA